MLDFATVLFINLVIGIMGSATFLILWIQNRKHLQGIGWGLIFSLIIILYLTLLVLGEIFPNSLSVLKPPSASLLTALTLLLIIQPLGLILYVQNRLSLKIKKELQYKTKLEEELKEANIKAEISVKTKEAFLANMSHEIRTPMNSILGFIDIALEGRGIPPRERNLILTAQTSAKGLLSIINDFLDISNLDASKLQIAQKPFMIIPLLEKVMDTMRLILAEKPLDIALDISDDLDLCIDSDPDRMRQILVSIIGNSIKFTERGKIIVSVQDRKDGMLLFTIADTGQGMTQDQTEHLFDLFYQADSSTSRTYGGNGLGTTISKELIKLMGGDIWVESILGKGSTFYFTLPISE